MRHNIATLFAKYCTIAGRAKQKSTRHDIYRKEGTEQGKKNTHARVTAVPPVQEEVGVLAVHADESALPRLGVPSLEYHVCDASGDLNDARRAKHNTTKQNNNKTNGICVFFITNKGSTYKARSKERLLLVRVVVVVPVRHVSFFHSPLPVQTAAAGGPDRCGA